MTITLIIGSQRTGSQSSKVAHVIANKLEQQGQKTNIIHLDTEHLPYRDETCNPYTETGKDIRKPYADMLIGSDGLVVVSPEWSGMVPAVLKNFFLRCMAGEIAHKAAWIVTVSSTMGGSYPVAELRMSSYKNTRICYMPDHTIVRNVESVLNGDVSEDDTRVQKRIDNTIPVFLAYTEALTAMRKNHPELVNSLGNGM